MLYFYILYFIIKNIKYDLSFYYFMLNISKVKRQRKAKKAKKGKKRQRKAKKGKEINR